MHTILQFLAIPWLSTIVAIISVIVAVYFYLRSRKVKRLAYQLNEITVVGGSNAAFPKEVEIQFEGRKVDCVTVSHIVLWNAGNVTIDGNEIVTSDPLRIELTAGGDILKIDVLKGTRKVNAIRLLPRNDARNVVAVVFDYLDPNDGATLRILHTATRGAIVCTGTVRGLPGGPSNYGAILLERNVRSNSQSLLSFIVNRRRIFLWVMLSFGILFSLLGLLLPIWSRWFPSFAVPTPESPAQLRWPSVALGAIYSILPAMLLWFRRRRYPSPLDPDHEGLG